MAKEKVQGAIDKINSTQQAIIKPLSGLDKSTQQFRNKRGSIISSAKSNIFEFPVFISSSVPMEYATATNSLLEQMYASYLQMAISVMPVVDHTLVKSGLQFANLKSDTGRYIECADDTEWQVEACHNEIITEDCHYEFKMLTDITDSDMSAIMEYVNHQPLSEFDHFFMEKYVPNKSNLPKEDKNKNKYGGVPTGMTSKEARERDEKIDAIPNGLDDKKSKTNKSAKTTKKGKDDQADEERIRAVEEHNEASKRLNDIANKLIKLDDKIKNADAKEKEQLKKDKEQLEKDREQLKKELDLLKKENALDQREGKNQLPENQVRNAGVHAPKVLEEKNIDRLNTLKPLLMETELNVASDDGHLSKVNYIVGVKTFCRLIDANTIPEVAEYPLKEMNKVVRKAKWRAGELKFFSDIVFRIKQKKQTAVDARNPKRKWYRRLYELAHMKGDAATTDIVKGNSVLASFTFDKMGKPRSAYGVIPDCTMVISKTDVDICKMQTNIDLLDGPTATKFCNELFLIGLVVIDTDQESIKVLLPDLHSDFDVHSLGSVNRQMALLDKTSVQRKEVGKFLR